MTTITVKEMVRASWACGHEISSQHLHHSLTREGVKRKSTTNPRRVFYDKAQAEAKIVSMYGNARATNYGDNRESKAPAYEAILAKCFGYTPEQLAWAKRYEADVWTWFLQENLLYHTDYLRIQKYFTEAPFTPELGENNESAPKLGIYIGWKIVRKYMDKHPEITLKELLADTDAQSILEKSKYTGK